MLKYNHPVLYFFVQYWPSLIVLPGVLLMIATLAFVTRRWDARDEGHRGLPQ